MPVPEHVRDFVRESLGPYFKSQDVTNRPAAANPYKESYEAEVRQIMEQAKTRQEALTARRRHLRGGF